jgi:hypothetical protein
VGVILELRGRAPAYAVSSSVHSVSADECIELYRGAYGIYGTTLGFWKSSIIFTNTQYIAAR